ncbi:hypothetical protein KEM48_014585 [Puccinia striiformis f. sp. tritici PST-130]|nr:hypothetical protein KEM48_014585 [Puccinia striiformis f. sp. tritici PST-130]
MKPFVLSTIMFGILSSGLAIASELEGHEVSEEGRRSISHHLSKRDVALFGNFPGLGGPDKANKVFTVTGSRTTASENVIPLRNRKALSFINSPGQKGGAAPAAASARKVAPAGQQKSAGIAPCSRLLDQIRTLFVPIMSCHLCSSERRRNICGRESPSSLAESDSLKNRRQCKDRAGSSDLVRRALFRRSLFGWKSLATRELTSGSSETESTVSHFQDSHRKLGEFPALGGLKGTVSAQEAEKIIEVRTSSSSSAVRSASVETQSTTVPLPHPTRKLLANYHTENLPHSNHSLPPSSHLTTHLLISIRTYSPPDGHPQQHWINHHHQLPPPPPPLSTAEPDRIIFSNWFEFNQRRHATLYQPSRIGHMGYRRSRSTRSTGLDQMGYLNLKQNEPRTNLTPQFQNLEPISAAVLPSSHPSSQLILLHSNSRQTRDWLRLLQSHPWQLHLYQWIPINCPTSWPAHPYLTWHPQPKTGPLSSTLVRLVYWYNASSKPPSEREPPIATGPGFSFGFSAQDPPTRHSSHTGISGSSWKNSVAPNLDAIDETARKVGGGLLTGAKYLSSWGQNLWNPNIDTLHSPRQGLHQSTRNDIDPAFSQSAPTPHMMSAARPTNSSRSEELRGVMATSKLSTCSPRQLHISGSPTSSNFHFKTSSDPLTFYPSTRHLTYYSHLPSTVIRSMSSNSVLILVHRGFWRWDSKIVSVLTEHGTHPGELLPPPSAVRLADHLVQCQTHLCDLQSTSPQPSYPSATFQSLLQAFEKIKHKSMRHHSLPQHTDNGHMRSLGYLDYHPNEHDSLSNPHHTSLYCFEPIL